MVGTKKTTKTSKTPKTKTKAKTKTKTKRKTKAEIEREQKREVLLDNLRAGMSIQAASSQAGISRSTYYSWIDKDEAWADEIEAAIRFSEAVMLSRLDRCIDDKMDWRGWAWRLQKRFPNEYGDLKQVDLNVAKQSDGTDEVLSMMKQLETEFKNGKSLGDSTEGDVE